MREREKERTRQRVGSSSRGIGGYLLRALCALIGVGSGEMSNGMKQHEEEQLPCRFVLKPATEPAYTKGSNSLKTIYLYDRREVILGRNRITGLNDLTQQEDPHIIFISRNHLKVEARDSSVYINPCCSQLNMVWVNERKCTNG